MNIIQSVLARFKTANQTDNSPRPLSKHIRETQIEALPEWAKPFLDPSNWDKPLIALYPTERYVIRSFQDSNNNEKWILEYYEAGRYKVVCQWNNKPDPLLVCREVACHYHHLYRGEM